MYKIIFILILVLNIGSSYSQVTINKPGDLITKKEDIIKKKSVCFSEEFKSDTIPQCLNNFKDLEEIYLFQKEIRNIPLFVTKMENLKKLAIYISRKSLKKGFPLDFVNLKNIGHLDVRFELGIVEIDSIKLPFNLKTLSIMGNTLKELPINYNILANLDSLEFIKCSSLDIQRIINHASSSLDLKCLTISNSGLIKINLEADKLLHLERLNLSRNKLTFIDSNLFKLKNLKYLFLPDNPIRLIETAVKKNKLEFIILAGAKLSNKNIKKLENIGITVIGR